MDKRQRLERGSILAFPGMECRIEEVIGCGSNAIVYKGWYLDQLAQQEKHHVLIKELFPNHEKGGIYRGPDGRICADEGEPLAFFLDHRESFEAGNRIHLQLLESCPQEMGANLNSFEMNGTLYTILGVSGGRSLEEELSLGEGRDGLRRYALLTLELLRALSAFHDSGYLHLDISPDNALILGQQGSERILLIDYNSACEIGGAAFAHLSFKPGYSAPELETSVDDEIGEAADLYSVAAVFYHMLMGRPLTLDEMLEESPPDAAKSICLQDLPQTVKSLVKSILHRGLATMPEDRYQTIAQMRRDFEELIDRIDCVGVTHWALWESGRRSVEELIRINPSLSYVKDEEGMYPIRLEQDGRRIALDELLEEMLSAQGKSRLTVSAGGMGKTTLLLRAALTCGRRYAPNKPAVFYVSLSGFSGADPRYIRSQILSSLRFKREHNTFDSAMHELEQLLGRMIQGRNTPVALLLLDGLNEVRGEIAPLLQEINLLSKMAGVRILAASRSEMPALELETNRMLSLTYEDVKQAAARRGVLLPQGEALLQLIRTPLILSIYLMASENSQQLHIRDQDDLMEAYVKALYQKDIRDLPENTPQRWQTDAALTFVLPAIAAQTAKAGCKLTDKQLLSVVEQCYGVLTSKLLVQAFPQWIGRSRDILGGAASAEAWYGLMVHDLLWQRLGLLMKDEQGGCGVFHQMVETYLCGVHRRNTAAIRKYRMLQSAFFAGIGMLLLAACFGVYAAFFMVTPYNDEDVSYVLGESRTVYEQFYALYDGLDSLIAVAEKNSEDLSLLETQAAYAGWVTMIGQRRKMDPFETKYYETLRLLAKQETENMELPRQVLLELMGQERKVVSWSGLPLDGYGVLELYHHLLERRHYYNSVFLPQFRTWYYQSFARDGSTIYSMTGAEEYLTSAREMIEADVKICQLLYDLYVAPHMNEEQMGKRVAFARLTRDSGAMDRVAAQLKESAQDGEMLLSELKSGVYICRGTLRGFGEAHELSRKEGLTAELEVMRDERVLMRQYKYDRSERMILEDETSSTPDVPISSEDYRLYDEELRLLEEAYSTNE